MDHINQMHPGQGVQHSREGPFDSVRVDWRNQPPVQHGQQVQPWKTDVPRPSSRATTVLDTPPLGHVGSNEYTNSPNTAPFIPELPPDSQWPPPRPQSRSQSRSQAFASPYAQSRDLERSATPPSPPPLQVPPIQGRRSPQPKYSQSEYSQPEYSRPMLQRYPEEERRPSPAPKPIPPMTPRTAAMPMAESRVTSARASPTPSRYSRLSRAESEIGAYTDCSWLRYSELTSTYFIQPRQYHRPLVHYLFPTRLRQVCISGSLLENTQIQHCTVILVLILQKGWTHSNMVVVPRVLKVEGVGEVAGSSSFADHRLLYDIFSDELFAKYIYIYILLV